MSFYVKDAMHLFNNIDVNHITDVSFTQDVNDNDVIVLNQVADNDKFFEQIFNRLNSIGKKPKVIITQVTEYIHSGTRQEYLEMYDNIGFLDPHIDLDTIENDYPLSDSLYAFNIAFPKEYLDKENYTFAKSRSKKFNFFNRSISLRRMKVYELILKDNIDLNYGYVTMGLHISPRDFPLIKTYKNYIYFRPESFRLQIDIDFIEENKDKFQLYESEDFHLSSSALFGEEGFDNRFFDSVHTKSLDSYASFIIESSSDHFFDTKLSEKTLRAMLCKNIFLVLGGNGFNNGCKVKGIETFEDVFGLEKDWDESLSELEKTKIFYNAFKEFSKKPFTEIRKIYNSDSVKQRLENNFNFIINALNTNPIVKNFI